MPVPYFHVVFSLPAQIAVIAYQNKAAIYGILFKASAETMLTIAADPKHLGARIGILSVLHTWGSALTHHPHIHMIVPGGGISLDGTRWVACRPNFLLAVEVLSCLFRRLVLEKLAAAHCAGELQFFGKHMALTNPKAFAAYFIERIRKLLAVPLIPVDAIKAASATASTSAQPEESEAPEHPCPCCGSNMRIIETFLRGQQPKHKPTPVPPKIRIDTS